MATVTSPIILDSTGQDIKTSIDLLTANINRTASNIPYDNNLTIKGKIDDMDSKKVYHKGDTVFLHSTNLMLAGRTGWAGKEFYFGIPLSKPIGSDISGASISFGSSGTICLVSYNQAIDITNVSRTDSIQGTAANTTMVTLKMAFTNAPLSITDGIVNLMLNRSITITFN